MTAADNAQSLGNDLERPRHVGRQVAVRTARVACLVIAILACGGCARSSIASRDNNLTPQSPALCSVAAVSLREYGQSASAGTANTVFAVTDDAGTACRLPSWPSLSASWGEGAAAKILTGHRAPVPFQLSALARVPVTLEPQAANSAGVLVRYIDINGDNGTCRPITTFTLSFRGSSRTADTEAPSPAATWEACAGPGGVPSISISELYPLDAVAATVQPLARIAGRSPLTGVTPAPTTTLTPSAASTSPSTAFSCIGTQLRTIEKYLGGGYLGYGLGHSAAVLLFTNISARSCSLRGYPGAAGLDGSGSQVVQASRTPFGYMGGLWTGTVTAPTVVLPPGGTASAMIEGADNPVGNPATGLTLSGLLVTPPNTRATVRLPATPEDCSGLYIHPVVPGTTGTEWSG